MACAGSGVEVGTRAAALLSTLARGGVENVGPGAAAEVNGSPEAGDGVGLGVGDGSAMLHPTATRATAAAPMAAL